MLRGSYILFFFFKQKTAYEMRISDWSSDVCSSDLTPASPCGTPFSNNSGMSNTTIGRARCWRRKFSRAFRTAGCTICSSACNSPLFPNTAAPRSEEHTSELQSLMRISYAVFCLKKKRSQSKGHQTETKSHSENH